MDENKKIPVKPENLTTEEVGDVLWKVMTIPARVVTAIWDAVFNHGGPNRRE